MSGTPLVEVRDLRKTYPLGGGAFGRPEGTVRAVDGVSFNVAVGETLALVGESGSGKSTIGRLVLRLESPDAGSIRFEGTDLASVEGARLRALRRRMGIVFQDPVGSLNPRLTAASVLGEVLRVHRIATGKETDRRVRGLLETVGLTTTDAGRYPHELSGGGRQRLSSARATEPRFLVADEPVSALDVSIQAQIVGLLADLRERLGLSYLLITHNLAVVRQIADRIAVLYLGQIVEEGPVEPLFQDPAHPYTEALLRSVPAPDPTRRGSIRPLRGEIPSPVNPPLGCPFHPRCPKVLEECRLGTPILCASGPQRRVSCFLHQTTPVDTPGES